MTHKNPALLPHTTWGEVIKANVGPAEQMKAAIEAAKKQAVINERLHPLNQYPYKTMRPIDPTA